MVAGTAEGRVTIFSIEFERGRCRLDGMVWYFTAQINSTQQCGSCRPNIPAWYLPPTYWSVAAAASRAQ